MKKTRELPPLRICIREIAEQQGITPTALASLTGLHVRTVRTFWRNPYRDTSTEVLGKFAGALNASMHQLLRTEKPQEEPPYGNVGDK